MKVARYPISGDGSARLLVTLEDQAEHTAFHEVAPVLAEIDRNGNLVLDHVNPGSSPRERSALIPIGSRVSRLDLLANYVANFDFTKGCGTTTVSWQIFVSPHRCGLVIELPKEMLDPAMDHRRRSLPSVTYPVDHAIDPTAVGEELVIVDVPETNGEAEVTENTDTNQASSDVSPLSAEEQTEVIQLVARLNYLSDHHSDLLLEIQDEKLAAYQHQLVRLC